MAPPLASSPSSTVTSVMSTGGRALAAFDVMVALVVGGEEGLEDSEQISSPIKERMINGR